MSTHPLVQAYHAIYDEKDRQGPGKPGWYEAYEALDRLAALMKVVGVEVPVRWDKEVTR